jgi:multiple sugar transport system substrate-binding protein
MSIETNRRRFLELGLTAAAVVAVPGISGCLPQPGPGASVKPVTPDEPKPPQLRVLYTGVEANVDAMRLAADHYHQQSGINVQVDSFPQTALREKLFAEMAAHSSYYDVVVIDHPWGAQITPHMRDLVPLALDPKLTDPQLLALDTIIPQLIVQGTYRPNQPYNPPMEFQVPDYTRAAPISLQNMQRDGWALIGMPFQPNVLVMLYRKDYFDNPANQQRFQAMHGRPLAIPETWDDFLQVAQFFTRSYNPASPTPYGITLMAKKHESLYTDWRTWCRSFGVVEINEKMDPSFATDEGVRATQFYADLINKHKVAPPESTTWTWDEVATAFGSGQTAISMNYHRSELDPPVVQAGGQLGAAMVPGVRKPDGSIFRSPHYGTYVLGISRYSEHPRWAWDFVLHTQSPNWQDQYAQFQYHGTRSAYYRDPEVLKQYPEYWPVFAESLPMGYARPRIEVYVQYSEILQEEIHNALLNQQSVATALHNSRARIIKLFNDQGYYRSMNLPVPKE